MQAAAAMRVLSLWADNLRTRCNMQLHVFSHGLQALYPLGDLDRGTIDIDAPLAWCSYT